MEICLTKLQPSLGILGKSSVKYILSFPIRHTPCSATPDIIYVSSWSYMSHYTPLDHIISISYHTISISPFTSPFVGRSYEDNQKSSRNGSRLTVQGTSETGLRFSVAGLLEHQQKGAGLRPPNPLAYSQEDRKVCKLQIICRFICFY